jgi:antitoxin VapB
MANQLNIKDDETHALASELASLTGESMAGAVKKALREVLERERRERDVQAKVKRVLALAAELRASMTGPPITNAELDDMLYDERGMWKGSWPGGD